MGVSTGQSERVSVTVPGSKSLSHRYLIAAGMADGQSTLTHVQDSSDISVTKAVLQQLGVGIEQTDAVTLRVTGISGAYAGDSGRTLECNVKESGTSCRLLTAVLAAGTGLFRIFGEGRMHERPIEDLCAPLTRLGAGICYTGRSGYPPFLLQARGLDPDLVKGELSVGMDASSQYFSGLLLAAPLSRQSLVLELGGKKAVSWPYVGLTLQCLTDFGIPFTVETRAEPDGPWQTLADGTWRDVALARPGCLRISVTPASYRAGSYDIEGDWSGASYFLAAGALGSRPVRVCGLREESLQGDRIILDILCKMGAEVSVDPGGVTVFPSALHGVDLDMGSCPDLVPTVAILAAFAHGSTRIRNVPHLKLKEADRIKAPAEELSRIGVVADPLSDGLLINGRGDHVSHKTEHPGLPTLPEGTGFSAHNDHRIAMSLALLDMVNPALDVEAHLDDPGCVTKSFPAFWDLWKTVRR